ncbi:catalytic domain of components of various dehydrogenase complexes [Fibrella aestuarina BUZ 2]|uniref:Dihydrolipoamide acetyltransferase component of pyruvate dehydrogenase complex n=1 Tax=Fibrella aestuarina BUZ 2 TaxID=1166018 RepID=I0K7D0_9BACT|nr:dihydrolipoamide acetyltransferase family protein [Fibrella aestuarina]CCH00033.1 catalytic domain of components of various dehydrogenase complexes [Fibrella aestuarina BUZ 2]
MALIDLVMPKMGESIMECTVITWLKKPGDRFDADESLLEVATDKVDTEVPAPYAGVLKELLVNDGDVVPIGQPIARIETSEAVGADDTPANAPTGGDAAPLPSLEEVGVDAAAVNDVEEAEAVASAAELEASIGAMSSKSAAAQPGNVPAFEGRFYSPLVLNIAKEEGISRAELDRIPGSGSDNRVTKKDMLAYVLDRAASSKGQGMPAAQGMAGNVPVHQSPPPPATPAVKPVPAQSLNGSADIIQMDRMRKMIAQRMVESKQISPHVTSFVEADLTAVVQWRAANKDAFKKQTGENLTYTPILIDAIVKAVRDFPMINVSVEGDSILVKKAINVGMAVALPTGNLIVPVIHDAAQYNLIGLTKKVNDLSKRARENKLTADDLAGGTYTVSNIGTFGNLMGTPIIMQPQVAIMAFGAIVKKPAVIETPQGDLIGIRHMMFLSHSYDHRVVDGALGGQFVRRVADYLEQWNEPNL